MAGIYLHIPFCAQRCVYCDFYFVTSKRGYASFVDALCREIEHYAGRYGKERIETIYFGGGTPSRLPSSEIFRILETLRQSFDAAGASEVTVEMNPEDADPSYLRDLIDMGVTRISLGIQSFFEEDLRFLNRSHSREDAEKAVALARRAGFDNFTADLIFGLPQQAPDHWAANLDLITRMGAPHVSTYCLTVEEKTPLHQKVRRGLVTPASEDVLEDRYQQAMDTLGQRGYEHYEISSFARPGYRARHNQLYWAHANYLGFGPSAHSFWWGASARRWSNIRNLKKYSSLLAEGALPVDAQEELTPQVLADERVLLGLRTMDGVDLALLRTVYGADLEATKARELSLLEAEGLIQPLGADRLLRLSDRGKHLCDAVTASLLSA